MAIHMIALAASGAYLAAYIVHNVRIRNAYAVCGCALLLGLLALCALLLVRYWLRVW